MHGQPALPQSERRTGKKSDGIIAQHPVADGRRRQRSEQEREFDFLRQEPGPQIRGDVDLDLEREIGVGVIDALDQLRQPGVDDGFGDAEPQHAMHRRAVADRRQHFRTQPDQLLGIHHHLPAARRRQHHAPVALQQPDPDLVFELGDPLRDRRLSGVELLGRAAKAAKRHHPHEGLDCLEINHALKAPKSIN